MTEPRLCGETDCGHSRRKHLHKHHESKQKEQPPQGDNLNFSFEYGACKAPGCHCPGFKDR